MGQGDGGERGRGAPLPAGILHRALKALRREGFHDVDRLRKELNWLGRVELGNELIELVAVDDLVGLGVLVQLIRPRLLPRLRRLRCRSSHLCLLLPSSSARSRRRRK